jgi:hypothetical protein
VPLLATVTGAAALALRFGESGEPRTWIAAFASVAIGLWAVRRAPRVERALGWGLAMVIASLGPTSAPPVLAACGALGALACAGAAGLAISRVSPAEGIARSAPLSPFGWLGALAAMWTVAVVGPLLPRGGRTEWWADHSAGGALAVAAASTLLLWTQAERQLMRRRLELGMAERGLAVRGVLATAVAVELAAVALGPSQGGDLARLTVALSSVLAAGSALCPDAVRVARLTRRVVVLAMLGGAAALLGVVASAAGADPWAASLSTAAVALVLAAAARSFEAPLRPAQGRWLDAFERARVEATRPEPEDAIREALTALRAPGGLSSPSPELWMPAPAGSTTVDAAGYLHDREGELPAGLLATASAEPEGTLRGDLLEALEVRRPDLRPLAQWLADRGALLATIIARDGEVEGVLLLPRIARDEPPTLEELRVLRQVADGLAAPCRARAAQARLLARARASDVRAETAEEQMDRLRHERGLDAGRAALAARCLARPATVGIYASASRMALEALERRTAVGAPIAIVAPSGVDPIPFLARAHLAGARGQAPLVLVDGTCATEHDIARWGDSSASPLALADRGLLVLLDVGALPLAVQGLVAGAVAEKRAPWGRAEPIDIQLAVTSVVNPDELVRQGRLDPTLVRRLGDASSGPVLLPRLRDRVEDLRTLIMDRLAREGMRVLGRPVGIDQAAYARLIEHPFPGEDAELGVVVERLVARCRSDVVRASDVDALRLSRPPPRRRGAASTPRLAAVRANDEGARHPQSPVSASGTMPSGEPPGRGTRGRA